MPKIICLLNRYASLLLMLALASCVRQGPSDLALRNVFLSNWRSEMDRWRNVDRTTFSQQAIVLELTTVEPFAPQEPFILEGVCGEMLHISGLDLYVPADRDLPARLDQFVSEARPDKPYKFYVLIPTWSNRRQFNPQFIDFNLERDNRDICLQTTFMRESYIWRQSNEVRVPRRLIDQAFRAGLKPLPAMKPL